MMIRTLGKMCVCGLFTVAVLIGSQSSLLAQERVTAIKPPATPLPSEEDSKSINRFAFIVYGDTRGRRDGSAIQYEHSLVIDAMLKQIKDRQTSDYPIRFILQSGDAVIDGAKAGMWNVSFVPLINRLTSEGGIPYFLSPGNHDVTSFETVDDPRRQPALRNYFDAVAATIPAETSPRRLAGYATYAIGYGNTFVLGFDANIAADQKQFDWVKSQLEGLDRTRYPNIIIFCHQAPFSSGPHGGSKVEGPTVALRTMYLPLFQTHHVRAVFSGHEHLFEHWVERYKDATGPHRMDLVVSGGGGAPLYAYTGEPDLTEFLKANESLKVELEHLVKPGVDAGSNPYHFIVVRVDGDKLDMEVIGVDWGRNFNPYKSNKLDLRDKPADPLQTSK